MKNKLNVLALGLAFGVTWALSLFVIGIFAWLTGMGVNVVEIFNVMYVGYEATLLGSIVGALWAFIDGFIGGIIIAWLYNFFAKKFN